jgi:large subunit ribosomal protein L4
MMDISMPKKIKLLAMKTLLSARLAEGRIIIVDNDSIEERKTKYADRNLRNLSERDNYLLVTGNISEDFKVALQNIRRVEYKVAQKVTLMDLLKPDKIVFTIDGILNMMQFLNERTVLLHKPIAIKFTPVFLQQVSTPKPVSEVLFDEQKPIYDPSQQLKLRFKVLQDYLHEYEAQKSAEDKASGTA